MSFHGAVFYQNTPQIKNSSVLATRPIERFVDRRIRPAPATMRPDNKKRRKRPRRPDGCLRSWKRTRVLRAKNLKGEFEKIRAWIDGYPEGHFEYRHPRSVMMLWVMTKRYGMSVRGMFTELHFRRGSRKAARLRLVSSKSRLHTGGCVGCLWRCLMS